MRSLLSPKLNMFVSSSAVKWRLRVDWLHQNKIILEEKRTACADTTELSTKCWSNTLFTDIAHHKVAYSLYVADFLWI